MSSGPEAELAALPGHRPGWLPPLPLPPGRLVHASTPLRDGRPAAAAGPVCWLSDAAVPAQLWLVLRAEHRRSGLWPLLVFPGGDAFGINGEDPASLSALDPVALLRRWWTAHSHEQVPPWSGPAPAGTLVADPDQHAAAVATILPVRHVDARLALVPAARSADTLGLSGWTPCDADTHVAGALSAVARTWEDRYGARVVAVGRGTLWLSVAAPPRTIAEAAPIAAEHLAFCPDSEPDPEFDWQVEEPHVSQYTRWIVGRTIWRFWWD